MQPERCLAGNMLGRPNPSEWPTFMAWAEREGWRVPARELALYRLELTESAFVLRDGEGHPLGFVTVCRHQRSAWVGNLTALAPYKPLFVAATTGVLGYGFYLVYWKPRRACANGAACATLVPSRLVRTALWIATVLVAAAFAFDYVAPLLLSV